MRRGTRPYDLLGAVVRAHHLHEPVHDGKQRGRGQHEQDAEQRPVGRLGCGRRHEGGDLRAGRASGTSWHCRGGPRRRSRRAAALAATAHRCGDERAVVCAASAGCPLPSAAGRRAARPGLVALEEVVQRLARTRARKRSPGTSKPSMRSRRKVRKSSRSSHQADSSHTGPK